MCPVNAVLVSVCSSVSVSTLHRLLSLMVFRGSFPNCPLSRSPTSSHRHCRSQQSFQLSKFDKQAKQVSCQVSSSSQVYLTAYSLQLYVVLATCVSPVVHCKQARPTHSREPQQHDTTRRSTGVHSKLRHDRRCEVQPCLCCAKIPPGLQ